MHQTQFLRLRPLHFPSKYSKFGWLALGAATMVDSHKCSRLHRNNGRSVSLGERSRVPGRIHELTLLWILASH